MKSRLCKYTTHLCMLLFLVFALFTACKDDEDRTITYSYETSSSEIESTATEENSTVLEDGTDSTIIPDDSIDGSNCAENSESLMPPDNSRDSDDSEENEAIYDCKGG